MSEAEEKKEDWAQAWIDERRKKLRNTAAREQTARETDDTASQWENLGADCFAGFETLLRTALGVAGVPLGWAREQQQEWRDLAVAQAEYRRLESELLGRLFGVQTEALDRLERVLRARASENRPLEHMRELYDLWVECGEDTYFAMARSDEYCRLQADLGNAAVRFRAQQQKIIERWLKRFDLPTRAELNSVHRELRALKERLSRTQESQSRSTRQSKASARRVRTQRQARR